jgi:pimeloyl-ACP methyl ester carboxylesterase
MGAEQAPQPDTIVLIHGLWMTPRSWEGWVDRYRVRGHQVLAPAWPGMEGEVEELRGDPSPIARLDARRIIDHYDRIVRDLPQPPILMGHSFGGAFVQVLLDRGLGGAGVAIDSAPVKGVLKLPWSTLRTAWPGLRDPLNRHRPFALTPEQFHYRFTNRLSPEESARVYERYAVPGSAQVLFDAALANLNPRAAIRVDPANSARAPLLLIAGGRDHVSPASLTRSNFNLYRKSNAVTDYREFPGRSHYTLGQDGWEDVADYALDWATRHAAPPPGAAGAPAMGTTPDTQ